jgi:hypothetical protein
MANFFKRGKKIIISIEKDELRESGGPLRAVLGESMPLESGYEILLNIGACEELCIESAAVLAAFAKECRKVGCALKITASSAIKDQFSIIGLDRHFQILSAAS